MGHALNITSSRFDRRALLRGGFAVAAASASAMSPASARAAVNKSGAKISLTDAHIAELQKSIKGTVILPSAANYDYERRVWSPSFDKKPALLVKVTSTKDVQAAVQFARAHDILTAVRCGGHSYAGHSTVDDGLVIDLKPFNGVTVDPARKTAHVAGGALLGNLDRATQPHKLATTAGVVSHTGVGGLATGGGQGRLGRKFGLTIDNNVGVEMVLADGSIVRANATENPDLHWAVRGGGGNFGIVTDFEFRLHEYDGVITSLSYTYPGSKAKDLYKVYAELSASAPLELTANGGLRTSDRGEHTCSISGTFLGAKQAGEAAFKAVAALGAPIATRIDQMDYVTLQSAADGGIHSDSFGYSRYTYLRQLDPNLVDMVLDYVTRAKTPRTSISIGMQGGVIAKVAETATAFADRDGIYQCAVATSWEAGQDPTAGQNHVRELWAMIDPMSTGGFYVNEVFDDPEDRVRKAYRGNFARLVDIKTKVDPTNFFHLNPNIRPRT
ncbi:MAG: FAD-binding oxidoreductase [Alphaproteobacteria bacterium]|nr:FAD-binding oxidoreductase [Alphaproteobacteria bacterium]